MERAGALGRLACDQIIRPAGRPTHAYPRDALGTLLGPLGCSAVLNFQESGHHVDASARRTDKAAGERARGSDKVTWLRFANFRPAL